MEVVAKESSENEIILNYYKYNGLILFACVSPVHFVFDYWLQVWIRFCSVTLQPISFRSFENDTARAFGSAARFCNQPMSGRSKMTPRVHSVLQRNSATNQCPKMSPRVHSVLHRDSATNQYQVVRK